MKLLGAHISTAAIKHITQDRCYVTSVTNFSPTYISWEDANTTLELRTSRHDITLKILHDLLETHDGDRWPILSMDMGRKPVRD